MDSLYEVASQLFKVSGHRTRVEILKTLEEEGKTAKDLAKLMDASGTYVHQHLNRLCESGLIKKNGKDFTLTTSGRIFISSFDIIDVVGKYNSYWEGHSVDKIPIDLMRGIKSLKNTELVCSAARVLERFYNTAQSRQKRLLVAIDRVPRRVAETALTAFKEVFIEGDRGGVKRFWLVGPMPNWQSRYPNLRLPPGLKIRTTPVEDIYMGIIVVDDKEAGVIFPDNNGSLDGNYAMFGKDRDFISWAEKSFWYMYKRGVDVWV